MAAAIRENTNVEGIKVHGKEQNISLKADDTTLYLAVNDTNRRFGFGILLFVTFMPNVANL